MKSKLSKYLVGALLSLVTLSAQAWQHYTWEPDQWWIGNVAGVSQQSGRYAATFTINDAEYGHWINSPFNPESLANDVWLGDNATPIQVADELWYWGLNPEVITVKDNTVLHRGDILRLSDGVYVTITSTEAGKYYGHYVGDIYIPVNGSLAQGDIPNYVGLTAIILD